MPTRQPDISDSLLVFKTYDLSTFLNISAPMGVELNEHNILN